MSPSVKEGKKVANSQDKIDHWIFFANNEVVNEEYSEGDVLPAICKLRHPKLGTGVLYLFSANCQKVFEVNCYKEKYRSWFIGNMVHQDGSIYMTSPVDPLFLVLPYMITVKEKSSQFMTFDQIVCDEAFPDCHKLLTCCSPDQLTLVAEWKDIDSNLQVYRYSEEKALCWLKTKVEMLAEALEEKKLSVSSKGSHSAIFVRSKDTAALKGDYLEYAYGIICEYLPSSLDKILRKHLGFPEECSTLANQTEVEPPSKKAKLMSDPTPTDDYSQNLNSKKDNKAKVGKLSVAQKKLSKVDKSGMKSISSFFSPKS